MAFFQFLWYDCRKGVDMEEQNIEIQNIQQAIELLKSYAVAKTQEEKDNLLQQIHSINPGVYILLTKQNYEPMDLASKLEKAIKLYQYKPKNMLMTQLAKSDDLENITGEFDTFDRKLSKMVKDNEAPEKIRDEFIAGTANVYLLAKQFSTDWIRRLNNHKDLVAAARNADETNIVKAYNKLFWALSQDFCSEYDVQIDPMVITDWQDSDIKPSGKFDKTRGIQKLVTGFLTKDMSESEKQRLVEECKKNPEEHKLSKVRINITNIKKLNKDPNDFFYDMISVFAHEMHHALDFLKPREGAVGPQIMLIDEKTYVTPEKDMQAYHSSATEISSHVIQKELMKQLKNMRY